MAEFVSSLNLIADFLFNIMSSLYHLFTSSPILVAVFAIWIIDRIFHLFDLIKG